jgi:hypothetical protein
MAVDGFVMRAALGDAAEVKRRIGRQQPLNEKHSVGVAATVLVPFDPRGVHAAPCRHLRCARAPASLPFVRQRLKYTALHAAADSGHLNVVQALVESGAEINIQRTVSVFVSGRPPAAVSCVSLQLRVSLAV